MICIICNTCFRNATVADPRPTEEDAAEDHAELVQLHERWEKVQRWIRDRGEHDYKVQERYMGL